MLFFLISCYNNYIGSGKIVKFADSEEEKVELSSIKALEKEGSGRVDKSGDLLANDRDNKEKEVTSEPRNDKKEISFSSFGHKNINTDSTDQDEPEVNIYQSKEKFSKEDSTVL